jgi:DNA-binding NtrC family response regulator
MADTEINFDTRAPACRAPTSRSPARPPAMLQFAVGTALAGHRARSHRRYLEHCRGRKRETAELLGVSLKTLYNRLNEYRSGMRA